MTKAHNMQAIFADNMDTLLGKHNMKELVANANQHGTLLDYTYFMAMRRGKANASIEKCEIAVEILRNVPGFDWVEVWMFFVPQYFKQYQTNALKETSLDATAELARYIYQSRTGESPEATMPSSSRAV